MSKVPYPLKLVRSLAPPIRKLFGINTGSKVYGEARFMTTGEMKEAFPPREKGLVIGNNRMTLKDSFNHLAVMGVTGAGKTSLYGMPNIYQCEGSFVVTDLKGSMYRNSAGYLKQKGYKIKILNPRDLNQSQQFNRLAYIRRKPELRKLAQTLAENAEGGKSFWVNAAANAIYLVLVFQLELDKPEYFNLSNTRWILNHMNTPGNSLNSLMMEKLKSFEYSEYLAFKSQDQKVIDSVLSTARIALDLWSDEDVQILTDQDTMGLHSLRKEKTAVFIIIPPHEISYYSMLLNQFYSACFSQCLEMDVTENDYPLFFFMDEFGNMGKIDNFANIITTLREKKCSISIMLQSVSQLAAIYGQENAKTIFEGGIGNKLFLSGLGATTAEQVERLLGHNTVYDTVTGGVSERAKTVQQPLMYADEIRMIRDHEALFISKNRRPVYANLIPFYKNPIMQKWTKIPEPKNISPPCYSSGFLDLSKTIDENPSSVSPHNLDYTPMGAEI